MIPDKAVEAAAQAVYEEFRIDLGEAYVEWPKYLTELEDPLDQQPFRSKAKFFLEAAAGAMYAQALRDAAEDLAQKLHEPGCNWGTRTNDIGHLLALADKQEGPQ